MPRPAEHSIVSLLVENVVKYYIQIGAENIQSIFTENGRINKNAK